MLRVLEGPQVGAHRSVGIFGITGDNTPRRSVDPFRNFAMG